MTHEEDITMYDKNTASILAAALGMAFQRDPVLDDMLEPDTQATEELRRLVKSLGGHPIEDQDQIIGVAVPSRSQGAFKIGYETIIADLKCRIRNREEQKAREEWDKEIDRRESRPQKVDAKDAPVPKTGANLDFRTAEAKAYVMGLLDDMEDTIRTIRRWMES